MRPIVPLLLLCVLASTAAAQEGAMPAAGDEPALSGYDPVAYFPEGGVEPAHGVEKWTEEHAGKRYLFTSEEHRDLFRAAPDRFLPAYDGWCAYAMAKDQTVRADPTSFRLHRGRLFLFREARGSDPRKAWLKDEAELMAAADEHWKERTGREPPPLERDTARMNLDEHHVALSGYDPVAYFPEGGSKPRKGKPEFRAVHEGAVYLFSSKQNQARFAADPAHYEPVYGGWCAWAIADSSSFVEVDPESFLVRENGLHVFYDGFFADTRKSWSKDDAGNSAKAETHWAEMVKQGKLP